MIPAPAFFVLAAVLFVLGVVAFFVKKDLLTQFMAVEIMLNAGNLAVLALAKAAARAEALVLFVITVAAAEAVIGLAVILLVFRRRKSVRTDELKDLRG